ncbi:MAG TPA: replicative DNA helicase [Steroidobacteraceae bacterium]|nr:replicative DNA helicase [Steroidobacteraceae bacterium]
MAGPAKARRAQEDSLIDVRTPPHSIEAEQAVLGGVLIEPTAWDNVADVVLAGDFYRPDHRLIFESIAVLAGAGKPCDVVTVSEQLERTGRLQDAGGLAYLGTLARDTPTAANVRAYAEIVRERALLRQLASVATDIGASVFNNEGLSARELVDRAEQGVFQIAEAGSRGRDGALAVRTLLPGIIDQIDDLHTNPDKLRGLPSGFTEFDKLTGGMRPGDLIIVAGRPSMGKSSLAVNMAEYAAVNPNIRASVAIFSMEMPSEQVITRMLASVGSVQLANLRSGRISDEDWVRITGATSQLSEAKIFVDETPALTPTELRARARRVKREHGLNLVVVDYLQLMQVPGTKENRATEIAEISRGLKALAKELAVPVIALSQLNRSVEQREHKKPVMSDLRECVTGDTLACLADGRRVPVRELVGTQPEVWALDERQRIVKAVADKVWPVGTRPVFRIELATGRRIRATAEHRLLSGAGWTTVSQLHAGDRLAVARRLPEPVAPHRWPDHGFALLGQPIGDGSCLSSSPTRYTTAAFAEVRAQMRARGVTQRAMTRLRGTPHGGRSHSKFAPRCQLIADDARLLSAPELDHWHPSEICWDRIVQVVPAGEGEVFDLTVPGPASWFANEIVSHNSGAIEQDADMILLIYRDEVYDRNTTKKGIAEIDLAKHRNGEIGTFLLTFQGQYTRFVNYAPDSYAEGILR